MKIEKKKDSLLRVKNINSPRKKVQIMRVNPIGSTHFAISTTVYHKDSLQNSKFHDSSCLLI